MEILGLSLFACLIFIGIAVGHPNENETKVVAAENEVDEISDLGWVFENKTVVDTRRILYGKRVKPGDRPYMVYLHLTKESAKAHKYRGWLCGGVIVDASYVLTSAACVEDADRFYVVSGTTRFVDSFDYKTNECVCNHRRRVVWKCIPKNYKFDFQDSVKWSANDIAIVKVDKPFKLGVLEKGCEFPTDLVCYNNISRDLEKSGTKGYILGWGSGSNFREGVYRRQSPHIPENAKCLQEAKVCVMDNEQCAKKWAEKFRNIIKEYMVCTKDVMKRLSELCNKKYANCTDVENRRALENENDDQGQFHVDLGRHLRDPDDYTARRAIKQGGFCENDHGGPLVVTYKNKERVVGVISACKIDPKSHGCHGPFLYTSVYMNRQFLSCAIHKDVESDCRRVFRTGITHEEWDVSWDNYKEYKLFLWESGQKGRWLTVWDNDNTNDGRALRESKSKEVNKNEGKKEEPSTDKAPESETPVGEKSKSKKEKREAKYGARRIAGPDEDLFYQSSRDENVNEPDDE